MFFCFVFFLRKKIHFSLIRAGREADGHQSWVQWWEGQPHNNKYSLLIAFGNHFSLSPSFCSPFTFLSPSSCPHYLSLVYSITAPLHTPQVLMPSCLLVLIFIYRFSSFSLPFLCTDGTFAACLSLYLLPHFTANKCLPYSFSIFVIQWP